MSDEETITVAKDKLVPPHTCTKVAEAWMAPGRSLWVGKLAEPVAPCGVTETHCLHWSTPLKPEIVYLVNEQDFEWLIRLSAKALGWPRAVRSDK